MDEFSYIFELFALLLGLAVAEMLGGFGQVLKLRARRKALGQAQDERVDETAVPASSSGCEAQPEAEPIGSKSPASSSEAIGSKSPASSSEAIGSKNVRIGWLVPLLGLLVLVDLATFWSGLWLARDGLEMTMLTVFCVLALIGGYYLVATQVFPDEPQLWPDFDAWYRLQKRFVVLGMFTINVLSQVALFAIADLPQPTRQELAANPAFMVAGILVVLVFPAFLWLAFSKRERVDIALIVAIIATQFFYAWAALGMEGLE